MAKDDDLESLRPDPRFAHLLARIREATRPPSGQPSDGAAIV